VPDTFWSFPERCVELAPPKDPNAILSAITTAQIPIGVIVLAPDAFLQRVFARLISPPLTEEAYHALTHATRRSGFRRSAPLRKPLRDCTGANDDSPPHSGSMAAARHFAHAGARTTRECSRRHIAILSAAAQSRAVSRNRRAAGVTAWSGVRFCVRSLHISHTARASAAITNRSNARRFSVGACRMVSIRNGG
jgi:hypothetical protein